MDSIFSFVLGLLTAALSLLGFVQQHPELPLESRNQAQQIAQQAITQATQTLTNTSSNGSTQSPTNNVGNIRNGTSGTPSISFNYPSGDETFRTGDSITIRWNAQNIPQNATMYLITSNGIVIKNQLDPSLGVYTWKIPLPEKALCSGFSDGLSFCSTESFNRPLMIKAVVYTPRDACLGYCSGPRPTTVASVETRNFRIIVPGSDQAVASCPTNSAPICGYDGKGAQPQTYANSCYFSAAKAQKLYEGECDYNKNPSVGISRVSIRGYAGGQVSEDGTSLRKFGNYSGVYIGDVLDINLSNYRNMDSVGTITFLLQTDGVSTEYASVDFPPNTQTVQMLIPTTVPAESAATARRYNLNLIVKDKNGVIVSELSGPSFVIVSGN
jgi:hypothetical protein